MDKDHLVDANDALTDAIDSSVDLYYDDPMQIDPEKFTNDIKSRSQKVRGLVIHELTKDLSADDFTMMILGIYMARAEDDLGQ